MIRALFLSLLLAACDETTLFIDIRLAAGQPQPNALGLSLYHDGLLHRSSVATSGHALPGSLLVKAVPVGPALRVQLDGLDGAGALIEQAAGLADIRSGVNNRLALTLGPPLADADGDGVPDVVDDCPELPDADQKCERTDLAVSHDLANDLARDGAVVTASCANAILCDDFESGDDSKWNPGIEMPKPEVLLQVDGAKPHAGAFALHTRVVKGGMTSNLNRSLEEQLTPLVPPFALRVWIYNVDTLDNYTLVLLLQAGNSSLSIGGGLGGVWVMTEDTGSTIDHGSTTQVPLGQWTCLEMVHDGTQVHLYTDGIERLVFAPGITAPYDYLSLGMPRWPAVRDAELFFDDFVLQKSRVGCP